VKAEDQLTQWVTRLGYPGFVTTPAFVPDPERLATKTLQRAFKVRTLHPRLVEALTWVAMEFWALDWESVTRTALAAGTQNRLGYLLDLAREEAAHQNRAVASARLAAVQRGLEASRSDQEDEFFEAFGSELERQFVLARRPPAAAFWRMCTDYTPACLHVHNGC